MSERLVLNRIQTPDGTILTSRSRHDYQEYKDKNGKVYMVDGGLSYLRRGIDHKGYPNDDPYKELSLWTTDEFSKVRDTFSWGTRGKGGREPLKYVKLKDLDSDHIEAILATQHQLNEEIRELFHQELVHREVD